MRFEVLWKAGEIPVLSRNCEAILPKPDTQSQISNEYPEEGKIALSVQNDVTHNSFLNMECLCLS